jgi:hypothetical protein
MSEYYYDDWNDPDSVDYDDHNKEVSDLENQVEDLKLANEVMRDDEVFVLSELMLIRDDIDSGMPLQIIRGEISKLIATHSLEVREKAVKRLAELEAVS